MSKRASKARLSLSMIVKNEEKFLEGCLASATAIVDEVVVVDTGSTDRTKEIAGRHGARIYDFRWTGDFSEARNFSLGKCSGDWVLYLDADERLADGQHAQIRQLLGNHNIGAYGLIIENEHSLQNGSVKHSNVYPRLFRRLPGVKFEGRVHEQILPSIKRLNLGTLPTPFTIIHLGYAQGFDVLKEKSRRNIELLRQQLLEDPTNAYAQFQLGNTLVVIQEYEAGKVELLRALENPRLSATNRAAAYNLLAEVEVKSCNPAAALEFCRVSLEFAPHQLMAHWFLALIYTGLKDHENAARMLIKLDDVLRMPKARRTDQIASDLELRDDDVRARLASSLEHWAADRLAANDSAGVEMILSIAQSKQLKAFGLHKLALQLSLQKGDVDSAFYHLERMTQATTADLSPLKNRITALAQRITAK